MIIPPIGGSLGNLSSITSAEALPNESPAAAAEGLTQGGTPSTGVEGSGGESGGFGGALGEAISSLESTQQSADSASQALAAGTATDPESAVVTVQDAQMAMELASQIRTKATEAAQSIFQTQV